MKKIISLVSTMLIVAVMNGQTIDTVLVRNLQLQAQDWAWLIGKNVTAINNDSASASEFRRLRDRIRSANPAAWTTNVTVDSIPGWVVLAFYKTVKSANAGEIVSRYTAITGAIEGKQNMASFITIYNGALLTDFNRYRDLGKHVTMDN